MTANCQLIDNDLHNLDGVIETLGHSKKLTKKLQLRTFTVADFYYSWHELKVELESFADVELVGHLLIDMEKRASDLIRNDVVHRCVFMDPRSISEGIWPWVFRH